MKITGSGPIQSSSIKKTSGKKGGSSSAFKSQISPGSEASETAHVGATSGISSVDALLALQGVPDSTDGRSKGLMRAEDMLDMMEEVRKGILLGAISSPDLRTLADMARNQRGKTGDQKLDDILSDIELRAEVELAKYGF